jgi:hypothetical protein
MGARVEMHRLTLGEFEPLDGFYLRNWGVDLKRSFPFLAVEPESHPYELFYQIWKLSYLFGRCYADWSIALEDFSAHPARTVERMLSEAGLTGACDPARLTGLIQPQAGGKWKQFADDDWFKSVEQRVEETLSDYFGPGASARSDASMQIGLGGRPGKVAARWTG